MKKYARLAIILGVIALTGAIALAAWFMSTHSIAIMNPKGVIAERQQQLIVYSTLLMAIVVLPVFLLTFGIAWRYRESNKKAKYSPELAGSKIAETIWWLIPGVIIVLLSFVAWQSSHELDPYKPITGDVKPLKVQVISLQWKWLFIYPDQRVASVNYLPVPVNTPLDFTITSDAPMNSFWIPQLGGQVYAMSGMSTKLHLFANQMGDFRGSSANISGEGFADMTFTARSMKQQDFNAWAKTAQSAKSLDMIEYEKLAKPSTLKEPTTYSIPTSSSTLYDTVVSKYMGHGH